VYPWESYLVFIISEQGIEFNAEKIEAILTMERPRCIETSSDSLAASM
jgi:hypothetical protein